jgi:hypothetical protein
MSCRRRVRWLIYTLKILHLRWQNSSYFTSLIFDCAAWKNGRKYSIFLLHWPNIFNTSNGTLYRWFVNKPTFCLELMIEQPQRPSNISDYSICITLYLSDESATSNTWYNLEFQRVRIVLRVEKSHFDHELCTDTIFSNVAYENESQF